MGRESSQLTKVIELLFNFVHGNEIAFGVEGADHVFIALEGHGGLFASSGGEFHGQGTVSVLDSSNGVALIVLFEVGVTSGERVGASPEFDSVEHQPVNEECNAVDRDDVHAEVNDRIEPLVAKSSVPLVELVEASIATVAARESDHGCAKKSGNTFFHFILLLKG